MTYWKCASRGTAILEPACSWGVFIRYLEISDDRYATRHVDLFENGNALVYDRRHWIDDYGMLADARSSKTSDEYWGAVSIEEAEFEAVWQSTEKGAIWPLQITSAQMKARDAPPWLTIAKRQGEK